MPKISRTFRLEEYTISRLETLADYFTDNARDVTSPFQKSKISNTDVLEYLINKTYEDIEKKEEEEWAEKNINKL